MNEKILEENPTSDISNNAVTQFLTFELNNEAYGVNILKIKEIIDLRKITKVPMMPNFIAGVINLRGNVVPVINLALRFSQHASEQTRRSSLIILEIEYEDEELEVGITVDVVNEVLDIFSSEIKQSPSFGTIIRTDFIYGMGEINGKLLVFLDMENILSIKELSVVNDPLQTYSLNTAPSV